MEFHGVSLNVGSLLFIAVAVATNLMLGRQAGTSDEGEQNQPGSARTAFRVLLSVLAGMVLVTNPPIQSA